MEPHLERSSIFRKSSPGCPSFRSIRRRSGRLTYPVCSSCKRSAGWWGDLLLAFLAVLIVSRRSLLAVFQVPGLIIVPWVFFYPAVNNLNLLYIGIFFAGLVTVAQFSFWGNYLPRVYPIYLRGTGESFAANVGGRILGTSFAWVTITVAGSDWLKETLPTATTAQRFAYTAAAVGLFVYAVGNVARFFLPDPGLEGGHE